MQDTNIQYQFFPRSIGLIEPMEEVINVFKKAEDKISSSTNDLKSDDVLSIVRPELEKIGYCVEQNKKDEGKIKVPVLFGCNNSIDNIFMQMPLVQTGKLLSR